MVFQRLWVLKITTEIHRSRSLVSCSFSGFQSIFFAKPFQSFGLCQGQKGSRLGSQRKCVSFHLAKSPILLLLTFGPVAEILICLHNWAVYFTVLLFCKVQVLSNFSSCCQITSYKSDYSNELLSILSQLVLFIMLVRFTWIYGWNP